MTQTSPQNSERLTSRQRRIEEQRRKIESVRSEQRRQRMLWLGGIIVVVAVAVLYRPDLCDNTCVQQLGEFYDSAPRSSVVPSVRHLVITPYQDIDHAVAVVAWGYVDEMDQVDKDRVMADFKSKVDAASAPERGAL